MKSREKHCREDASVSEFMWTEVSHVIIDLSTYLTRNRAACLESSTSRFTAHAFFRVYRHEDWWMNPSLFVYDPAAPRILRTLSLVDVYVNEFFFFFFTSIRDKLETLNRDVFFFSPFKYYNERFTSDILYIFAYYAYYSLHFNPHLTLS